MEKTSHILFVSRANLYSQPGGDTVQMEQTAERLRSQGYTVDIAAGWSQHNARNYELVHFFNLIRPADMLKQINLVKRLVITSIYVDFSVYEKSFGNRPRRWLHRIFGKFGVEYFKTIFRWLNGSDVFPGWKYLLLGQRRSIRELLTKAEAVITASEAEADLIRQDFPGLEVYFYQIALGTEHFEVASTEEKSRDIACIGRIEGLKNQLGLIRAVRKTPYKLDLFGQGARNQPAYLRDCVKEGMTQVSFKGMTIHRELRTLLPQYRVHALPSFFETTGLANLEALAAGCQVVISHHPIQKEIFGDHAHYCEPSDHQSIREAIEEAIQDNTDHRSWVKEHFSWKYAADQISAIYQKVPQ